MKRSIQLPVLPLFLLVSLVLNIHSVSALQQSSQVAEDDIVLLKKANASLKNELSKQRSMLMKQMRTSDSSVSKLKAANGKQQAAINDLQTLVSNQQAALDKVPEAIAARSYLFGKKRILAVSLIVIAFLLVVVYIVRLQKRVDKFIDDLKRVEDNLNQKQAQANTQLKDYLTHEIADLKAMLEKQTHENKNRIVALLADANQMVHKMSDEVNRNTDMKIAALKNEHGTTIAQLTERLNNFNPNKSL